MNEIVESNYFEFTIKVANELFTSGKIVESLMCFIQMAKFMENLSIEERDKVVCKLGDDDLILDSIAIKLEDAGKFELSEIARKIHLQFDSSYILYGNLGRFYIRQKDFVRAKSYIEKALELFDPDEEDVEIRESLGLIYLELGEYENAIINLAQARETAFKSGETKWELWHYGGKELLQNIYLSLCDEYLLKNYTDFCLLLLHKAIQEGDEYSDNFLSNVYRRRGDCYINKGDLKEATFCFEKVIESDPNNTYAKNMISTIEKLKLVKEKS